MRKWTRPSRETQKVGILLFDQFSNYGLANAVEPLRAANDLLGRKVYEWEFLTLTGSTVTSSSGLPVVPDGVLSASSGGDVLFLLPGYGFRDLATPKLIRALRSATRRYSVIAGLDTGSWLMAKAELLVRHRATIHWDEYETFAETFPDISATRSPFTMDGNRWTCAGAIMAFDLVQRMIGQTHGEALCLEIGAMLRPKDVQVDFQDLHLQPKSQLVASTVAIMRENLENPKTIPELTQILDCNRQKMESLFNRELRAPPRTVYRRLRLSAVRRLIVQTRLSVAEISLRCGYENPSSMTRAFREEYGTTPQKLRKT